MFDFRPQVLQILRRASHEGQALTPDATVNILAALLFDDELDRYPLLADHEKMWFEPEDDFFQFDTDDAEFAPFYAKAQEIVASWIAEDD
jgi:hypothetical protein